MTVKSMICTAELYVSQELAFLWYHIDYPHNNKPANADLVSFQYLHFCDRANLLVAIV